MNKPCLLIYLEDPELRTFIEGIAAEKRLDFYFATQGEQLLQCVKALRPLTMIVDLSGLNTEWLFKHIAGIMDIKSNFPIVAVVASDEEGTRYRLERAGCKRILKKSEVEKRLPGVIEDILRGRL